MKQQALAACLVAVLTLSQTVFSASSFVRCNDIIECSSYNDDPKVGGIRRCKPRKTSTMACSTDYCCNYDTSSNNENTDDSGDNSDSSTSENTDNSGNTDNTDNTDVTETSTDSAGNTDTANSGEVDVPSVDNSDNSYFIDFTDTTDQAISADAVPLVIASGANSNTGNSFVRCNTAVNCSYYKVDDKKGGIMRCKPRTGSTQSCMNNTCCAPPPPPPTTSSIAADPTPTTTVVRCSKVIKSCKTYYIDPIDKGILRCQMVKGLSTTCSKKFCCKTNAAQADIVPTKIARCDTVVACSKYKKDSSDGGSKKCKQGQGYTYTGTGACTTGYCCAANNPQPDKITKTTAKKTTTQVVPKPDPTPDYSSSSFVLCSDIVRCNTYYSDPKTKGMLRCKPRASSTMACGTEFCCAN